MKNPLVSVCCITYNHGPFVRDCLDGILMQKTLFDFEILINDDASTDGTIDIIKEYEKRYPDKIKPLIQKENQYSKGVRGINANFNFPRARGKYIALCEGDDYWTDPLKLQKQVDFMESNPDCSLCYHASQTLFMEQESSSYIPSIEGLKVKNNVILSSEEVIEERYIRTVTMLFKMEIVENIPPWFSKAPVGDYPLLLTCADQGNVGYLAGEPMSVYRRGVPGAWSANENLGRASEEGKKWAINRLETFLIVFNLFNEHTSNKYNTIIQNRLHRWIYRFFFYFLDTNDRAATLSTLRKYSSELPFKFDRYMIAFWLRYILGASLYKKIINKYPAPF